MRGVMADRGNYKVATIHWWANYMRKRKKEKEKEKEKRKKNKPIYVNRIASLLYSTFKRVPIVFYHVNSCWNGYANKDNYSCLLDGPLCS